MKTCGPIGIPQPSIPVAEWAGAAQSDRYVGGGGITTSRGKPKRRGATESSETGSMQRPDPGGEAVGPGEDEHGPLLSSAAADGGVATPRLLPVLEWWDGVGVSIGVVVSEEDQHKYRHECSLTCPPSGQTRIKQFLASRPVLMPVIVYVCCRWAPASSHPRGRCFSMSAAQACHYSPGCLRARWHCAPRWWVTKLLLQHMLPFRLSIKPTVAWH